MKKIMTGWLLSRNHTFFVILGLFKHCYSKSTWKIILGFPLSICTELICHILDFCGLC